MPQHPRATRVPQASAALQTSRIPGDPRGHQPVKKSYMTDWFSYVIPFTVNGVATLAPLATAQFNLQIQADSSFELIKVMRYGNLHGGTPPFQGNQSIECSVLITDGGSGRNLMSAAVPIDTIAGTGQLPFILPESRIFVANSTVQFVLNNFSAANTYDNVSLVLSGRKIYDLSAV